MASSLSTPSILALAISLWALLISLASSQTCTSQKFSGNRRFANCSDLPVLTSYLHWTYDVSNNSLSVAFTAPPAKSEGWVAWAINPTAKGMAGAQAFVAAKQSNGSVSLKTYNISSYSSIVPSSLSFEVWNTRAEYAGGNITIFATVKVPTGKEEALNHIWQVGPGINHTTGFLEKHEFSPANLNAKGTLNLVAGTTSSSNSTTPAGSGSGSTNGTTNSTTDSGKNGGVSIVVTGNSLSLCLVSLLVVLVNLLAF